MAWAARYHVNGLQFYDWQYRHETLLPPSDPYTDLLGRRMSLATVERLIEAAHARNIAAMPYTAIYGASPAFYRAHPDWALLQATGEPFEFADGHISWIPARSPQTRTCWANSPACSMKPTSMASISTSTARPRSERMRLARRFSRLPGVHRPTAALWDRRGDGGR